MNFVAEFRVLEETFRLRNADPKLARISRKLGPNMPRGNAFDEFLPRERDVIGAIHRQAILCG
jgi:hypothetical protein